MPRLESFSQLNDAAIHALEYLSRSNLAKSSTGQYRLIVRRQVMMLQRAAFTLRAARWQRHPLRFARFYANESTPTSRIARIEARLPRFLQRIVTPLRNAPVSHITAFLILHEITAVVPLFGLAAVFHYANWLPPYISEGQWVKEGTERFGKYLRKKGWISDEDRKGRWWGRGEGGVRIVVELATAYAITKALLPLRLALSVWGTPWFARWTVLPMTQRIGRLFSRRKAAKGTTTSAAGAAAGTGAVAASAVPKEVGKGK